MWFFRASKNTTQNVGHILKKMLWQEGVEYSSSDDTVEPIKFIRKKRRYSSYLFGS